MGGAGRYVHPIVLQLIHVPVLVCAWRPRHAEVFGRGRGVEAWYLFYHSGRRRLLYQVLNALHQARCKDGVKAGYLFSIFAMQRNQGAVPCVRNAFPLRCSR